MINKLLNNTASILEFISLKAAHPHPLPYIGTALAIIAATGYYLYCKQQALA
jgi:hypothetical protein